MSGFKEGDLVRFASTEDNSSPCYGIVGKYLGRGLTRDYKALWEVLIIKRSEIEVDWKYDDKKGCYCKDNIYDFYVNSYGPLGAEDLEPVANVDEEIEKVHKIIARLNITLENLVEHKRLKE